MQNYILTKRQKGVRIQIVNAYKMTLCSDELISRRNMMELLNRKKTGKVERPVKVLQFGEGNFLRAFVDYMIDIANEQGKFNGDIVLVKPIEFGSLDRFHDQECQYIRNMQIMQNLTAYVTLFRTQQKQVSFMMIQTD